MTFLPKWALPIFEGPGFVVRGSNYSYGIWSEPQKMGVQPWGTSQLDQTCSPETFISIMIYKKICEKRIFWYFCSNNE